MGRKRARGTKAERRAKGERDEGGESREGGDGEKKKKTEWEGARDKGEGAREQ